MGRLIGITFLVSLMGAFLLGSANASGNGANKSLLSQPASGRASTLGYMIGQGCNVKDSYYMGLGVNGASKDTAYWSVQCRNGKSYVVELFSVGPSKVLECSLFKSLKEGNCFKKLP